MQNCCACKFLPVRLRIYSEALRALSAVQSAHHADAIIISDANSVFIECILEECGVADVFRAVFTNPASFNSEGLMTVTWHHTHSCQLCAATPHMCKGTLHVTGYTSNNVCGVFICVGTILKGYLEGSDQKYSRVVYVGDGKNDLCPLLQLGKGDVGVVRKGYGLEKALARGSCDVKPTLHVVDFIHELGDVIESKCL